MEIKATLGGACPSKSQVGTGTAVANGAPVIPAIPENVKAYAGTGQIIFVLTPAASSGQLLVLHGKVSANKVTTEVPVLHAGGLNIVITAFNLTVKTIGSDSKAFITAGKRTAGKFTVRARFLYQTGNSLTRSSSSKCKG